MWFSTYLQEVWEAQYGPVDPYNLVTTEQFLEEMHHALNDKPLKKKIHKFLPYLFKVFVIIIYFLYLKKYSFMSWESGLSSAFRLVKSLFRLFCIFES